MATLDIPDMAVPGYQSLSDEQKVTFVTEYSTRKRSTFLMVVLAVVFPIQLFLLGKVLLGILFWLTGGGFGVWYVIEWFLTPGRVRSYNSEKAMQILTELGASAPTPPTVAEESEPQEEDDSSEE